MKMQSPVDVSLNFDGRWNVSETNRRKDFSASVDIRVLFCKKKHQIIFCTP
jgi:hypothetical protein